MPVENQTTEQPDPQVACCDCEEEYQIEELENSPQGDLVCEYCISENYFWCDMCGDGDNRDYGYWSDTYDLVIQVRVKMLTCIAIEELLWREM